MALVNGASKGHQQEVQARGTSERQQQEAATRGTNKRERERENHKQNDLARGINKMHQT